MADVLLTAAMQVLDGMLQLQEQKIVHCDLALRNILAFRFNASDYDLVHVKITDYGLARPSVVSLNFIGEHQHLRSRPDEQCR
jgi:serine/threonine protein kinase